MRHDSKKFRFFGAPSTKRSPVRSTTGRAPEIELLRAGWKPAIPRLPPPVLAAPRAGTTLRPRWRPRRCRSPFAILTDGFLSRRKRPRAERFHGSKPGPAFEGMAPSLLFFLGRNVLLQKRDYFRRNRFAVGAGPLAQGLVDFVGDVFDVEGCHREILGLV